MLCSQGKADTIMFLHIKDVSIQDAQTVKIKTVDTDVIIVALIIFPNLSLEKRWIEFGSGKNITY